jgi:indolepyruvate ferredoxin oxidoreductase
VRQATGYTPPPGGLHYRWPDLPSLTIEQRLHAKLDAVRAFARVNSIDRHVVASEHATVGIVTAGKAHGDFMEVLRRLDISPETLARMACASTSWASPSRSSRPACASSRAACARCW